ncbi:MAG TPA: dolichyl-phosphate beta-glucosyltransferase [Candidatus Polarisedimenticolaceae bacterium]|nr:dolichyl-phosphate beta-glucosyltransferase [Candidatus Polarisedimenticolaceae bacterium]
MSEPELSLVIPAYNEEARLGATLQRVRRWLDARHLAAEILVVDDGSTDRTAALAAAALDGIPGAVLGGEPNRGKGYAVRRGLLAARGRTVLITDADLSTPIEEHDRLADVMRRHELDVVIGSRALYGSQGQNPLRQLMGKTFNRIMRSMTGLPFQDTQCGFKLLDRAATHPIVERMVVDRFAFDVELLFLCGRAGLRVEEVPVVWRNAPGSKVSLFGDPVNMLWDVARLRWRHRRTRGGR